MDDEVARACSMHGKRDHLRGTTCRWVDIKTHLKEMALGGGMDWIHAAHDKNK